ncbi:MAG TPA: dCTP deaminase [bacterium]|nr:dCTP deaminase [bacterium]
MPNDELKKVIKNIVHEPTQFPPNQNLAYLTVAKIGKITRQGSLDFGGSEYREAEVEWIQPELQSKEDKYGWWDLAPGLYQVQFNESLSFSDDSGVLLQIWSQALKAGVAHPTEVITESRDPLVTLLQVSEPGSSIKENARLSEVRLI